MKTRLLTFTSIVSVLLLTLSAQAYPAAKRPHAPTLLQMFSWTVQKWDQPDTPYTKIRFSIESQLKKGVAPEALIRRYDNAQKFQDTKLVFGYAVASYERARRANFSLESMKALPNPKAVNGSNPDAVYRLHQLNNFGIFPHNAECARILFLWEANNQTYSGMYRIAPRLVAHFSNDFDLKWWAFHSVMDGDNNPNTQLLLRWADELQRRRPNAPGIGILKPMVYYTIWCNSRLPVDEKKAVGGFRHFLTTAPANDPQRKNAEFRLALIPVMKKIWAKQAAKQKRAGTG